MTRFNHDFSSRFRILKGGKVSLVVSALLGSVIIASAAPTGGVVTSGTANISQNGTTTNINQSTQKATINWNNFSIAQNETVNFNQPNVNSITLNRVIGNEKSIINGALNANGQVWILNSNGVLFGKNASINTSGILATTAQLSDADFNAGNYKFKNATSNSVVNLGTIEVSNNGYVVLASNEVRNEGTIKAVKGKVHLTGASEYTINLNGNSIVNLIVDKGVLDAMVENKGTITANGGEIYLTTNAVNELLKGVVNNTGILEASSLDGVTGKIVAYAHGGTTNISGTLDATGGFVETSGEVLHVSDSTTIKAKDWLLDPTNITIASGGTEPISGNPAGTSTTGDVTISASTIDTVLNGGTNVTLTADNNINVNEALSWSKNLLTLTAGTSTATGSVYINALMSATGTAGLALNTGASGNVYAGMNGDGFTGRVDLSGTTATTVKINNVDYTVIKDRAALATVTGAGKYVLGDTINLSTGGDWAPLTSFAGVFDGLGNTVSNMTITTGANFIGLFSEPGGASKFRNVGVVNANISNVGNMAGILVANLEYGSSITNSYSTGTIQGGQSVGGLVGGMYIHVNNSISNSFSTASVTGTSFIGGLVGASNTTISNSYATGAVTSTQAGTSRNIGGLVGSNNQGTINNSYSTGLVTIVSGSTGAGGFVGNNLGGTITNSFWDKDTSGIAVNGVGSGATGLIGSTGGIWDTLLPKTTAEMKTLSTFTGTTGWTTMTGNDGEYPTLTGNPTTPWKMNGVALVSVIVSGFTGGSVSSGGSISYGSGVTLPTPTFSATAPTSSDIKVYDSSNADVTTAATAGTLAPGSYTMKVVPTTGFTLDGTSQNLAFTIAKKDITYALSSGATSSVSYGTGVVLPTTSYVGTITGNDVSGTPTITVYDSSNANVTAAAINGTLTPGTYTIKAALTDPKYALASSGNTQTTLTIAKLPATYTLAGSSIADGASVNLGTAITLPTNTLTVGTPTGTSAVKVYNASNVDVTTAATNGTLGAGSYTIKIALSDTIYDVSSTSATIAFSVVTPPSPAPSGPTVEELAAIEAQRLAALETARIAAEAEAQRLTVVIAAIINTNTVKVEIPQITPPVFQPQARPIIASNVNLGFGEGAKVNLVSRAIDGEPTRTITLAEIKAMQPEQKDQSGNPVVQDTRVSLSDNSVIDLVNGGVYLPDNVEQEFYVVEDKRN